MNDNYWENRETINVDGEYFKPMEMKRYNECYEIFDIVDRIASMEYAPYYDKFILCKGNKIKMCEKSDLTNVTEI